MDVLPERDVPGIFQAGIKIIRLCIASRAPFGFRLSFNDYDYDNDYSNLGAQLCLASAMQALPLGKKSLFKKGLWQPPLAANET